MRHSLFILFFCCLCVISCKPRTQSTETDPGDYDEVVSVAIHNLIRHEKRFLSQTDVFDIRISSERNLLAVSAMVKGYYENKYEGIISPKDTTIEPVCFFDENELTYIWIAPPSDTILLVKQDDDAKFSEVLYSAEDVSIDYSLIPNRMIRSSQKLFVWQDTALGPSKEVIDTLSDLERVDYGVKGIIGFFVINDGEEVICYDLDALRKGRIKKYHDYGILGKGFRARLRQLWFDLRYPHE